LELKLQRRGALCALQCLALALPVATEHQSPLGRVCRSFWILINADPSFIRLEAHALA